MVRRKLRRRPDAEDEEDRSAAAHSGQIWKYSPARETIELVALFPVGSEFDGPDNITVGPHGFAVACTDGEDSQWLVGITGDSRVFPFGFNALNDTELAGATFSPDGRTLFANLRARGSRMRCGGRGTAAAAAELRRYAAAAEVRPPRHVSMR